MAATSPATGSRRQRVSFSLTWVARWLPAGNEIRGGLHFPGQVGGKVRLRR